MPEFSINTDIPILNDVPIAPGIVLAKLSNLNPDKAAGPDNGHPKFSRKWLTSCVSFLLFI